MPILLSLWLVAWMTSCAPASSQASSAPSKAPSTTGLVIETQTPYVSETPESVFEEHTPTPTLVKMDSPQLWIDPSLPEEVFDNFQLPDGMSLVMDAAQANLRIEMLGNRENKDTQLLSTWIYVLVAPFPTITDAITLDGLMELWHGNRLSTGLPERVILSTETFSVFERQWGTADPRYIQITENGAILEETWQQPFSWALVPFDQLSPRWKVLQVEGVSPLDKQFNPNTYPLSVQIVLRSENDDISVMIEQFPSFTTMLLPSNFDPEKLTTLVMTGTTALVRYTALQMEENGVDYPARDIGEWLSSADITHISNEVPFYSQCPPAMPVRVEQRFCSDPAYIALLDMVGAEVIELTGNHILDWGPEALFETLDLYKKHHFITFGGGANLQEARKTLFIEDHGNRLAFMGCSPAGPEGVWATEDTPGSNPCDFEFLSAETQRVIDLGYIPIMTFQHFEVEDYTPHSSQRIDFMRAASLGAAIVSGSQSHFAQTMTFVGNSFVHYGLGNLFFDQMYGENPHEFIDQHYFYDGKYINTRLLTALLEDFARPRPMTLEEREDFLATIFSKCVW